jgi:hypothetical protein
MASSDVETETMTLARKSFSAFAVEFFFGAEERIV